MTVGLVDAQPRLQDLRRAAKHIADEQGRVVRMDLNEADRSWRLQQLSARADRISAEIADLKRRMAG